MDATPNSAKDCRKPAKCGNEQKGPSAAKSGAVLATLHNSTLDPGLDKIIRLWPHLSEGIKATILDLIDKDPQFTTPR
jgi:hypothetical protein